MQTFPGLLTRSVRLHNAFFSRTVQFQARSPFFPLKRSKRIIPILVGVSGLGIGVTLSKQTIHCDSVPYPPEDEITHEYFPPPPSSSVSLYQLTFGTVTGICAGVFVKKGIKAAAWFLGGIFILLQYLGSLSLIRVDWPKIAARFEDLVYIRDTNGHKRPPTIASVWHWLVDFLTADFQPRASFMAGLALGLRIG